MPAKFKRTGGAAIAERGSASNLYHIEQTGHNEGIAIFLSPDKKSAKEYKITGKLGTNPHVVDTAFKGFNADVKKEGSSIGSSYWKHFRGNKLLQITPSKEYKFKNGKKN